MKNIAWVFLGIIVTLITLRIIAGKKDPSQRNEKFKLLIKTPEAKRLMNTNEFVNLITTPEFIQFSKTLAREEINSISQSLLK